MRLSIIIPVYNASRWLVQCLDSIRCQGLAIDDYEIVIVDDGSVDNSLEIIEQYRLQEQQTGVYAHWTVVSQNNKGASAARNAGIKLAHGDYIWWIDSDDSLEPEMGCFLLEEAERKKLDIVCFGLKIVELSGVEIKYPFPKLDVDRIYTGKEYVGQFGFPPNVWSAIFRREFLINNQLFLKEGIVHEDLEFPPRAFFLADRLSFVPRYVYRYVQTEGSVMRNDDSQKKIKKCKDLLEICDSLYEFIQKKDVIRDVKANSRLNNHISFCFSQSLKNYSKECFSLDEYRRKPYYPLQINEFLSKKDKMKYWIANFSLPLYLFLNRK